MDREDILLSDPLVPVSLSEFPDDRRSTNEALASMVGMAKVYDRILTLADEHGLYVDGDEFSTLRVSSGGSMIGAMMVAMRRSGAELDFDRLVVGASVMDSLTSVADVCGITLAMMEDSLIVAYFNGEIIGQIAMGAGKNGVELAPGRVDSPDRSDAVEEAWGWFCARIPEIPDSKIV